MSERFGEREEVESVLSWSGSSCRVRKDDFFVSLFAGIHIPAIGTDIDGPSTGINNHNTITVLHREYQSLNDEKD